MSDEKGRGLTTLSRRNLLVGLTGVGAVGTLTGLSTAAILSDTERFSGLLATGAVDLYVDGAAESQLDIDFLLDPQQPTGSKEVRLTLPTPLSSVGDGSTPNNPAMVWLRSDCPEFAGSRAEVLSTAITVTLAYCDGTVIRSGPLYEVSQALRNGIALDASGRVGLAPGEQDCLTPGDELCLRITWTFDNDIANFDGRGRNASVTYDLQAIQCRHVDGSVNPFPPVVEQCAVPGRAISWFAACVADPEVFDPNDLVWSVTGRNFGGEPTQLTWELAPDAGVTELSHFVLNYGETILVFDGGTAGTATVDDFDTGYEPLPEWNLTSNNWCRPGENGVKWEHVDDDHYEIEPEDRTLAVAVPETPGASSSHAATVPVGTDAGGADLEEIEIEYANEFDLSGVTNVTVDVDGVPVDGSDISFLVDVETMTVTVAAGTPLASGAYVTVTYSDVVNAPTPGRYPLSVGLTTTADSQQTAGRVTVRTVP